MSDESNLEKWKAHDKAMQRNAASMHRLLERFVGMYDRTHRVGDQTDVMEVQQLRQDIGQLLNRIDREGEI